MAQDFEYLTRLNSVTKYPSILNYHKLGEKGRITDTVQVPFEDDDTITVTEKIDGVNARIILPTESDYTLGSREEIFYAKGDRNHISLEGIVSTLLPLVAEDARPGLKGLVMFGEVFGGVTRYAAQYTGNGSQGFRLFDVMSLEGLDLWSWHDRAAIASWRENGGQSFKDEGALADTALQLGVDVTPRLATIKGRDLPVGILNTYDWLQSLAPSTRCGLDNEGKGRCEGVVIRTLDRSKIAKIRVQEYEKTMRSW